MPVNFNFEIYAATFFEKVISQLIFKIGENEKVRRLRKKYVVLWGGEDNFLVHQSTMQEFASLLMKEEAGTFLRQLAHFSPSDLEGFHQQFLDFIRHYRNTIKDRGKQALSIISNAGLSDEDFTYKKNGPQNFFRKCAA